MTAFRLLIKDSYAETPGNPADAKVKQLLTENGLIKDERVMAFIQGFKVRRSFFAQCGPDSLLLSRNEYRNVAPRQLSAVPISERAVLTEILLHLKKSLNFVGAGVLPAGEPRQIEEGGGAHEEYHRYLGTWKPSI